MQGDIGCELEMLQGQDLPHVGPYSGNARGLACYPTHKVSVLWQLEVIAQFVAPISTGKNGDGEWPALH